MSIRYGVELVAGDVITHPKAAGPLTVTDVRRAAGRQVIVGTDSPAGRKELVIGQATTIHVVDAGQATETEQPGATVVYQRRWVQRVRHPRAAAPYRGRFPEFQGTHDGQTVRVYGRNGGAWLHSNYSKPMWLTSVTEALALGAKRLGATAYEVTDTSEVTTS